MTLVTQRYTCDNAIVVGLKLSTEKAALSGTETASPIDNQIKPKISKSNTEYGLRPRYVIIARLIGTAPDTFRKYARLPVLSASDFALPAFSIGASITYKGNTWEITAQCPEDF